MTGTVLGGAIVVVGFSLFVYSFLLISPPATEKLRSMAQDKACSRARVMTSTASSMQNASAPTTNPMTTVMTHLATLAVWRPACLNL